MTASCVVGIVTSQAHKPSRKVLTRFLSSLTYPNLGFLFTTVPGDAADLKQATAGLPNVTIIESKTPPQAIREEFLKRNDDLLFLLNGDVMGPKNIIEALDRHQKPLACGVVLSLFERNGKKAILPAAYVFDEPGKSRQVIIPEIVNPRLLKLSIGTTMCLLARRKVIEDFPFVPPKGGKDPATGFFLAAREAGNDCYLDTLVKCLRLPFPPEDERNKVFDARAYQLKVKASLKK